ncbi:bifunctional nuclease family protein [Corynebacterium sp. CCUG 71335]|uniref:bifunctional nuclease family protein n=1 Tax=unclassified Corynebacterium TaxID=2624378 RepID=UPI00210D50D6|nr:MULTISPECIES: bifunctional nuclease family protein [unclassified Corynebacterium]MCQ4620534.1 bifunctional nuclease family protein [Corynebacterium sp. CCUG 71335]MCQ4622107.1 bifunctional nuclease family protein [Corynebacterium sp. CCUG 70398]MCQ4624726.1 bifunctional nuclease family protein [Corynebacterium sp. CCUG 69979]
MTSVPVTFCGVFPVGPESFLCALLLWEERRRFVPVWLPPVGGAQLIGRIGDWEPTRPDTHDLLLDLIEQSTAGIAAIELTNYHNGVFMAQITMEDGAEFDCRPTDAFVLSVMLDMPIEVDETVWSQSSLWLSAEDALDYFDIEVDDEAVPAGSDSASGDAKADADFQQLMRDLGVSEQDLGFERSDVKDVTEDDSGEE